VGDKSGGKVGSKQFPNKLTESLLSVKSCVRQLTVFPRKIGNPLGACRDRFFPDAWLDDLALFWRWTAWP